MSFLLDTNVISEWTRPRPDAGIVKWLAEVDEDRASISVITLAELRYGIERLPTGKRRTRLEEWLREEIPLRFEGRVLPVDEATAHACGVIVAQREASGRPIHAMDALIAATAKTRRLTVVTRNLDDFAPLVEVINPWKGG